MDPKAIARYREELLMRNPELLKQIEALRAKNAGGGAPQYGNDTARQVFQNPGQMPELSSVKPFELKTGVPSNPGMNLRLASDGNRFDGPEFHMPPESGAMNMGKGVFDQLAPKREQASAAMVPNGALPPQAPVQRPAPQMPSRPMAAGGSPGGVGGGIGGGSGVGQPGAAGAIGDALKMITGAGKGIANVPSYLSGLIPETAPQGQAPVPSPSASGAVSNVPANLPQAPLGQSDPSNYPTYGSSIAPRDRERLMAGFQPKGPGLMEQLGIEDAATGLVENQELRDSKQWADYVDMGKRLKLWKQLGKRPTPEQERAAGIGLNPNNIRF